jgi:uncharacterized lipoprotein YajG
MPRRRILWVAGWLGGLLVSGCALTPHDARLTPATQAASSDIGRGTRVFFRFIDVRDDVTLGQRGNRQSGTVKAADLPRTLEAQLRDMLERKQFEVVTDEPTADARVIYRLRSFRYGTQVNFWTLAPTAVATLEVEAWRKDRSQATIYRSRSEKLSAFSPEGDKIDSVLNAALDDLLQQAGTDGVIFRLLANQYGVGG